MKQRLVDRIPDYVLGDLSEDEMREITKSIADSPALAREAAMVREALTLHAGMLRPIAPPAAVRERLLATLDGVDRFRPFMTRLCEMLDLSEEAVRHLLARIDDASAWDVGPVPGLFLTHFQPGPRWAPAEAGFVRVTAGHAIPRHRHIGPEVALVLEGTMCEDGVRHFPGETVSCGAGSVHGFKAGSERDLVFVVTHSGIEIL